MDYKMKQNKKILIGIVILAIVGIVLISGCVEEKKQENENFGVWNPDIQNLIFDSINYGTKVVQTDGRIAYIYTSHGITDINYPIKTIVDPSKNGRIVTSYPCSQCI